MDIIHKFLDKLEMIAKRKVSYWAIFSLSEFDFLPRKNHLYKFYFLVLIWNN